MIYLIGKQTIFISKQKYKLLFFIYWALKNFNMSVDDVYRVLFADIIPIHRGPPM